ncbi:hypothetical protein BCR33DRAFT_450397 [Rhizoclosmatium globosum]|uniref:G-protein coupled receptors family 3 profile domain-containing protein n=1 Tax=Rhizoclosmatium globosum TaxID=329046 RepID=A0A1Y2CWM2_9FUNG|nr:hypothetical protein BCR33DRAFT_450397 [Rhizoclosmatium globosum]|eukprot:ORY51234.1 hypothetical protein BCR33DRAFT_450397 [Rhizoclosmatium globosum]
MFNGGMTNPPPDGPTPVALELIEYTSEEFYGRSMIVMSSVGLTLTVAFLIIVILYHKNPIIKSASIFNTLIFLIGCAISYATILAQLSPKYVMQCQLRLVGLELGFILTISPLIFKNALLSHLFHMTSRIKGVDYMTVRYRIANAAVILIEVILLSLRISHANFVIAEKSTESYTQRVCEDQNDPVAYISKDVLLYYNLCILLCFLPVLYYLQNVRWSRYNETAQIAIIFVIILIAIGMVQLLGFSVDKYSDFHISVVSFVCLTLILFASVGSRVLEVILEQRQFADLLYRLSLMHTQVAIQGEKMMRSKSYSADGISKPSKSMRSDKSLVAVFETSLKPKAIKSSEIGGGVGAGSVAGSSSKALLPAGGQFLFLSRPETIKAAKMDTIDEGVFYRVKDAKSRYWWSCWKVGEPLMVKLQTKKKWICFSSHYISECFVITDTTKWVLEACTLRLSLKDETVSTARDLYVVEIEFENVALANRFMAEVKTF